MKEQLLQLDRNIFHWINHDLSNGFFNWLCPIVRNPLVWIPLYVFIFVFCLYRYKKTGAYIILMLALTFGIADRVSAGLIKPEVQRLRPCHEPAIASTIIVRVPCGSGYSFPSSHASNHFAIACFLSLVFYSRWKNIWWVAIPWAFIISFAQVYVGVHYPFDVTFGALFGMLIGYVVYLLFKKLQPQF
jgi:membrane-associated phospholipid phosphatase